MPSTATPKRATKPITAKVSVSIKTTSLERLVKAKKHFTKWFEIAKATDLAWKSLGRLAYKPNSDHFRLTPEGKRLDNRNYDACNRFDNARRRLLNAIENHVGQEKDVAFQFLDGTILGMSCSASENADGSPIFIFPVTSIVKLAV
jgi:hypothetical protein